MDSLWSLPPVTEATVQTREGRQRYWEFLQKQPDLPALTKLFGGTVTTQVSKAEIDKQSKMLFIHIHPDKVEEAEKPLCQDLFRLIREAQEACHQSELDFSFCLPDHNHLFSLQPKIQILGWIEKGRWERAKSIVLTITVDAIQQDPSLAHLCTLVWIRVGDLERASDCMAHISSQACDMLKRCHANIVTPSLNGLLTSINELMKFQECCQKEVGLSGLMIMPYTLYIALKDLYRSGEPCFYEKWLRQAIRLCPIEFPERLELIKELQSWINETYGIIITSSFETSIKSNHRICERFLTEWHKWATNSDYECIDTYLKNYIEQDNVEHLNSAIKFLDHIIAKSNYTFSGVIPPVIKFYTDRVFAYSPEVIDQLKTAIIPLRAVYFSYSDRRMAASYFEQAKKYVRLGLLQAEFHEYDKAIRSWGEKLKGTMNKPGHWNLVNNIFSAMNRHDTFYPTEINPFYHYSTELESVDWNQEYVIKKVYEKNHCSFG